MFQLPLLGAGFPGLLKSMGSGGSESAPDLTLLLRGLEGSAEGFSEELQAMLAQVPPQILQELEMRVAGGMKLPQAARSLLAESDANGVGEWFRQLMQQGLAERPRMEQSAGPAPIPVTATATPAAVAEPLLRPPGFPVPTAGVIQTPAETELAQPPGTVQVIPPAATAAATAAVAAPLPPPAQAVAGTTPLPPPLAANLLDMGVPHPVADKAWAGAIADRVMWMVQGDQQFARLQLNPPQLGPLEVRVSVQQDQTTSVSFIAQHAAVREALEAALPRLREMFDQQSMQLVRAEVNDPGTQHAGGGTARDSFATTDDAPGLWDAESEEMALAEQSSTTTVSVSDSLVDLFA